MRDEVELLRHLYDRFNARDMEAVLSAMHEDVVWANGMEGGQVHGREQVRSDWTRQWAMSDPRVEPAEFSKGPEGDVIVEVHQTVRDLDGNLLAANWSATSFGSTKGWSSVLTSGTRNTNGAIQSDPTRALRTHYCGETSAGWAIVVSPWGRPGSFCGAGACRLAH